MDPSNLERLAGILASPSLHIRDGVLVQTFTFTNFQDVTGGYTFTLPLRVGPVHGRYNYNVVVGGDLSLRDFEFDVTLRKLVAP